MDWKREKTTPEQRERVLALVDLGRSYREVAANVFGDVRFRGRVERLVRAARDGRRKVPPLKELVAQLQSDAGGVAEPGSLEELVRLYGAMLKQRLEAGKHVKGSDLVALADLERRVRSARALERANALTRRR